MKWWMKPNTQQKQTNKQKKKKRNRQTAGESKGKEVGGRDETGGKKEREAKIN